MSPSFVLRLVQLVVIYVAWIQLHQFHKVEMVTINQKNIRRIRKMTANAENISKNSTFHTVWLPLYWRQGSSAVKTYDLEVWIPAQKIYREISSCSNQKISKPVVLKFNVMKPMARWNSFIPLNGSDLAVGRTVERYSWKLPKCRWFVTIQKLFVHTWWIEVIKPIKNKA